jgi:2-hydroxychromene-2-carboxylate isomerase
MADDLADDSAAAMAKVEFHFDFGSPNAYLAHLIVPQIEQRTGVKFEYVPILLGGIFKLTNNRSPAEKMAGIKNRLEYERLEMQRFVRRHEIARFTWNPFFPVNTLLIMRGAVAAKVEGGYERYVDEVFRHMWAEPKKMDDPAVFEAALTESGMDGARLLARTQEAEVKNRLLKNTAHSVARGAFGAPTFFVGKEIFFGKDRLQEVEEEIVSAGPSRQ